MKVIFSHADDFSINTGLFIASWKVWFKRFSENHRNWKSGIMPIGQSSESLSHLIRQQQRFSLEVLCRMMVPWSYRNSQQVDDTFLSNYSHLLVLTTIDDGGNEKVPAALLSAAALSHWNSMTFLEQDQYMSYAEARIQADIEVKSKDPVVLDDQGIELIGEDTYPPYIPEKEASDEEFLKALVQWIEDAPFQAYYLKKPTGDAVASWHDRALAFFWPKPRISYHLHNATLNPLYYRANQLAKTLDKGGSWDQEWSDMAVKTVEELFQISGTPQRDVTLDNIQSVMQAAISANEKSTAKMNSGWSYLASVCTAHLEGQDQRLPMVCWNSRIASSIISRLDFLLAEAGVTELGSRFAHIGTIPGWGGTRPRQYSLNWPNGYRSWATQVAASKLVNKIATILNTETLANGDQRYRLMPLPGGAQSQWTVRGVQTVLFSDGY